MSPSSLSEYRVTLPSIDRDVNDATVSGGVTFDAGVPSLLSDYLDQYSLLSLTVEFAVEDLFPAAKVELAMGYSDNNFPSHDGSLKMCIGVILEGVMSILRMRLLWGNLLQPFLEVGMKAAFVIIDENRGGDMHGVTQENPFRDGTPRQTFLDLLGDVYQFPASLGIKPQLLPM
jgi:hypothetical protein